MEKTEEMNPDKAKRLIRSIHDYEDDIANARTELGIIWYELSGVKGVDFSKVRGTDFTEYSKVAHFQEKETDIKYWEKMIETAESNLARAEGILKQLPEDIREAVTRIYIDGETYETVAREVHFSISGLYARIEKAFMEIESIR